MAHGLRVLLLARMVRIDMKKPCFICKLNKEVKPIGLKKMGCKEIYLCENCSTEMKDMHIKSSHSVTQKLVSKMLSKSVH